MTMVLSCKADKPLKIPTHLHSSEPQKASVITQLTHLGRLSKWGTRNKKVQEKNMGRKTKQKGKISRNEDVWRILTKYEKVSFDALMPLRSTSTWTISVMSYADRPVTHTSLVNFKRGTSMLNCQNTINRDQLIKHNGNG